jgi:hypothetical protein
MELATAGAMDVEIVRNPIRSPMPMTLMVVKAPLAAEKHQWDRHAAIEVGRCAVIIAVARVAALVIGRRHIATGRVTRRRIPGLGVAISRVCRRRVATA